MRAYLARSVLNIVLVVEVDGLGGGGHVGSLSHQLAPGLDQGLGIIDLNLVLCGTGQCDVVLAAIQSPWPLPVNVLACIESHLAISNLNGLDLCCTGHMYVKSMESSWLLAIAVTASI